MKRTLPILFAFVLVTSLRAAEQAIDIERAKALFQRSQAGEKLTDEEQRYLEEARRQRAARDDGMRQKMRGIKEKMDRGEKLTEDEQRMAEEMRRRMGAGAGPSGAEMEKARTLFEKKRNGEKLTVEEEKFLEEAQARRMAAERAAGQPGEFSWERAQAAHAKEERGETLTDDEKKLLAEARKRFEEGRGPGQPQAAKQSADKPAGDRSQPKDDFEWEKAKAAHQKQRRGEALSDDEKKLLEEAKKRMSEGRGPGRPGGAPEARRAPAAPPPGNLVPLTEMTAKYKDQDGGLYGGGKNAPPEEQAALARRAIAEIKPLDRDGKPSADGKVALMSIGMSNTTQEFSTFVRAVNGDSRKASHVVVVDAAQGGQDGTSWASADANPWRVAEQRLQSSGVTPAQVQAVWIKQALKGPEAGFPAETERLRDRLRDIVTVAKEKYPNLRVAYLSGRIYAGYARSGLNPEPYAYESAFAVRWLIEEQMKGAPALNADPGKGAVKAPVLLWGPYLWANGESPRKADGLVYKQEDLSADGTHPSRSGQEKVAKLLLDFFTADPLARGWFVK